MPDKSIDPVDGEKGGAALPAPAAAGKIARPDVQSVIAALGRNHMRTARRQLRQWWISLRRERLPGGDCCVVGGYFFCFEFQWEFVFAMDEAAAGSTSPRIFVGSGAFWRVASPELWNAGRLDELRRRLPGVLGYYYPQVYLIWARLLVIDGRALEAGKYFLFSGLYDEAESEFVARFTRTLARSHPNEILGRMPGPCRQRWARYYFPDRVYEDLATVPCPDWLKRRPSTNR